METQSFSSILVEFMVSVAILAGVPLALATISGFITAFFQAITQVQDQTLAQTVKITAVVVVLLVYGVTISGPLMNSTVKLFDNFMILAQ